MDSVHAMLKDKTAGQLLDFIAEYARLDSGFAKALSAFARNAPVQASAKDFSAELDRIDSLAEMLVENALEERRGHRATGLELSRIEEGIARYPNCSQYMLAFALAGAVYEHLTEEVEYESHECEVSDGIEKLLETAILRNGAQGGRGGRALRVRIHIRAMP